MAASITSTPNKVATQGTDYTYNPTTSGISVVDHWSLLSSPTGMTSDHSTGAIHWTPHYDRTNSGPISLVVYGDSTVSVEQDWTVAVSFVTPSITSTPSKTATENVDYTYVPTAAVVDLDHWSLTGAPSDLVFTPSTGAISWIPLDRSNSGTMHLTVTDLNGLTSSSQDWTVAVNYTTPIITSTPDTTAYQNTPFTYQPTTSDVATDHWTITGTLPANMVFSTQYGTLNWTPTYDQTAAGPFTLTLIDPADKTDAQTFTITVAAQPAITVVPSGDRTYVGPFGTYTENLIWDIDTKTGCLIRVRK